MKKHILDNCLGLLVDLREMPVSVMASNGRFDGYIDALLDCQRINIEEWQRLYSLARVIDRRPILGGPLGWLMFRTGDRWLAVPMAINVFD